MFDMSNVKVGDSLVLNNGEFVTVLGVGVRWGADVPTIWHCTNGGVYCLYDQEGILQDMRLSCDEITARSVLDRVTN
jgi:hypothetical protein